MPQRAGFGLDSQDLKLGVVFDRYGILSNRGLILAQGMLERWTIRVTSALGMIFSHKFVSLL